MVAAGLVFIVSMAIYAPTLQGGFVYDDLSNVVENRWIRSIEYLPEILTSPAAGFSEEFESSYYRPMMHIIYMGVYAAFGLQEWAFHLLNVLLHATNSLLVFLATSRLVETSQTNSTGGTDSIIVLPVIASLVFAAHPVHSESVAWVAGITDLSFSLFFMLAFLTYARQGLPGPMARWASAGLLLVSALCKEPALSLLAVLLAYEWIFFPAPPRVFLRRVVANLSPQVIAASIYLVMRVSALGSFAPSELPVSLSTEQKILNALVLFGEYLWLLLIPVGLTAIHSWEPVLSLWSPRAMIGVLVAVAYVSFGWKVRRRPLVLMALVLLAVPLVPALYVPALGWAGMLAERYLYLSVWGFGVLLGWLALNIIDRGPSARLSVVATLLVLLGLYSFATLARTTVWRDSLSLWSDAVRKSPNSAIAYQFYGHALLEARQLEESILANERAISLDRRNASAMVNSGVAYFQLGKYVEAGAQFERAISVRPGLAHAHSGLADVHRVQGQIRRALKAYNHALFLNPTLPEAHWGLATVLWQLGDYRTAMAELEEAARLAPANQPLQESLKRARQELSRLGIKSPNHPK